MLAARSRADARRARTESAALDHGLTALADAIASTDSVRHERPASPPPSIALRFAGMLAKSSNSVAASARRSAMPIRAYIGPNGAGKTLFAVRDALRSLDRGRIVYSTVPLLDWTTGEPHELYRPFGHWSQFMEAEHADFLADEISGIAASRDHNNLHSDVINRMHQLRKADVTFSWTAPAWRRADLALREVTWCVTECRGFFPDREAVKGDDAEVLWAPRRIFRAATYDMREFDEWSAGKRERLNAEVKEWFNGVGSREFASYRTLDAVDRLEGYDPKACPVCGKTRRQQYCSGHDHSGSH